MMNGIARLDYTLCVDATCSLAAGIVARVTGGSGASAVGWGDGALAWGAGAPVPRRSAMRSSAEV